MTIDLDRDQVRALTGIRDDGLIAEILASGASADELARAVAWVDNDEPLFGSGEHLASGRMARLVDILARAEEEAHADPERMI